MSKKELIIQLRSNVRVIFDNPTDVVYPVARLQYRFKILWFIHSNWKTIARNNYYSCDCPSPYNDPRGFAERMAKMQRKTKHAKIARRKMIRKINNDKR
jgi:hypothetical protein